MKFFTDKQMELAVNLMGRLEGEEREIMATMIATFAPPKWRNQRR